MQISMRTPTLSVIRALQCVCLRPVCFQNERSSKWKTLLACQQSKAEPYIAVKKFQILVLNGFYINHWWYFQLYRDAIIDIWPFSPRFTSNGHNQKVHMHMVDLMSSIICEGDTVSQELLDTVLVNLVPAHKVRAQSQKSSLQSDINTHSSNVNVDASRNCSVTVWSKLTMSVDWGI